MVSPFAGYVDISNLSAGFAGLFLLVEKMEQFLRSLLTDSLQGRDVFGPSPTRRAGARVCDRTLCAIQMRQTALAWEEMSGFIAT
jgi:hypothetical protein